MKFVIAIVLVIMALTYNNGVDGQSGFLKKGPFDDKFLADLRDSSWWMYNVLNPKNQFKNFVFSPYSMQHVLGMLAGGANGNTEFQILQALRMQNAKYNVYDQFRIAKERYFEGIESADYPSKLANRAYIQEGFSVKPTYTTLLRSSFGADFSGMDVSDPQGTSRRINDFVSENTGGRITDISSPDDIDSLTVMFLVNALYFQAKWKFTFTDVPERMSWYTEGARATHQVKSIITAGEFFYIDQNSYDSSGMQYFAIPYDVNSFDVYFVIALPKRRYPQALKSFEEYMSYSLLSQHLPMLVRDNSHGIWKTSRKNMDTLTMPAFSMESDIDAVGLLRDMGVTDMFSDISDFRKIVDSPPLKVSSFKHSANIDVDKEGTTAAAATIAGVASRSFNSNRPLHFKVDQPFFFGIYQDGNFLFMGNYYSPSEEKDD